MAGPRQPIALVQAKGKKHLTKSEIEERTASEVQPCTDEIKAPAYLTAKQKKSFDIIASQLQKIKIMGETDVDTLARCITAQSQYEEKTKELRALQKTKPKREEFEEAGEYYTAYDLWLDSEEKTAKLQDRFFKQAQTAATSMGLTITSRCRLSVPVKEEEPKENKFNKFKAAGGG